MDARSLKNLNTLHPAVRKQAIVAWIDVQAAMPANVQVIVIQGLRSFEESNALYAQGRTTKGSIVTWAPGGSSYHNYGLAFDFAMVTNGKNDYELGPHWMKVVEVMAQHGWLWGGLFPAEKRDNPHFEKKCGHTWQQLKALHEQKNFIPGTEYVTI